MNMRSLTQTKAESSFTPVQTGILQRKCASCGQHTIAGGECGECQKKRSMLSRPASLSPLQRRSSDRVEPCEVSPIVGEVLRSPDQFLNAISRASRESPFGQDFSSVRVHTDTKAAESRRMEPIVQYMRHNFRVQPKLMVGASGDKYEQEADQMAERVMSMSAPESQPPIQGEMALEEEEVQTKSLAGSTIQRETTHKQEEEPVHMKRSLKRMADGGSFEAGGNLESRLSSSKGGGSALPDDVRSFMEPRFGTDFSQVRVHTDGNAVQMNRELNAQAFVHKQDIYFGAGKSPGNDALTAHELTHVVQQRKTQNSIQRQELFGRSRIGRLFRGNQTDRPEDWWNIDRLDWPNFRANPQANSFIRAVIFNTQHNKPHEFTTVSQRHDYYRVIDFLIQSGQMSPNVQGVRFFEAAGVTTGPLGVGGAVSSIGGRMTHSAETRQVLTEVNQILFEANMNVINRLNSRRQPTDPNNPADTTPMSTLVFDLNMVEMEQNQVEQFITANRQRMTATVVSEINADLNSSGVLRTMAPIRPIQFAWARNALGVTALDFQTKQHRIAIGKAMVFLLHGHNETQYQEFMNNGRLP